MYPRLRDLRNDAELSQTEFAKMLGMSQTGYSKYETGENDIPTQVLIAIAQYYHTSVDYLLGLTDEPKPYGKTKKAADRNTDVGDESGISKNQKSA